MDFSFRGAFPAAQSLNASLSAVYTRIAQGQNIGLGSAVHVLGICAAGALFWARRDLSTPTSPGHCHFKSEEDAARRSLDWRTEAWDLLHQSRQLTTGVGSLEGVQARMVLADVVYNVEGTTSRYLHLHSCALAAAREMSLHLVDLPGHLGSGEDESVKETKRRMWWHLASTDWLLGMSK